METKHSLNHAYLIMRHGHSKANKKKLIVSRRENGVKEEYGLTTLGREQVQASAQSLLLFLTSHPSLSGRPILFISSPFSRTIQTTEICSQTLFVSPSASSATFPSSPHCLESIKQLQAFDAQSILLDSMITKAQGANYLISDALRERNFGEMELQNDGEYKTIWQLDEQDAGHKVYGVESVIEVWYRVSNLIWLLEERISKETPCVIILVAHGDVLQITQTAMQSAPLSTHRSLVPLVQAEYRLLPSSFEFE